VVSAEHAAELEKFAREGYPLKVGDFIVYFHEVRFKRVNVVVVHRLSQYNTLCMYLFICRRANRRLWKRQLQVECQCLAWPGTGVVLRLYQNSPCTPESPEAFWWRAVAGTYVCIVCICMYAHACMHIYLHACLLACIFTCICICMMCTGLLLDWTAERLCVAFPAWMKSCLRMP
jgi:hypothetical protein